MSRFLTSASLLVSLSLTAALGVRGTALPVRAAPTDTIVVRLPNQATLMLLVRNAAQLRQMKNYHLDSLTSRLAGYIVQAEKTAQTATTDQVTVQYYPDRDQPGKNLPEQIRITTRKKSVDTNRVEVILNKAFGVTVTTDQDGSKSYNTSEGKSKETRQLRRDSTRQKRYERRGTDFNLVMDVGLNVLANSHPYTTPTGLPETVELRTEGSRYFNIGFNWDPRLGGKRSPLRLLIGPEFSFNNYMLNGNDKWVSANGRTNVVRETDGRQFEKTKLATSSVNLPLMLQLKFHDTHYKPTFVVSAGGFVGYRLKSWTKLKYVRDGNTYKDKDYASYNMENLLYGLQGTIGYRDATFFAKYNMNQLFKNGAGPDTQVVSVGVRICGN